MGRDRYICAQNMFRHSCSSSSSSYERLSTLLNSKKYKRTYLEMDEKLTAQTGCRRDENVTLFIYEKSFYANSIFRYFYFIVVN
jgi:hypothetical protein